MNGVQTHEVKSTEVITEATRDILVFTNEETSDFGYVLCCLTTCCLTTCCCPFNMFFLFLTDRTTYIVHE